MKLNEIKKQGEVKMKDDINNIKRRLRLINRLAKEIIENDMIECKYDTCKGCKENCPAELVALVYNLSDKYKFDMNLKDVIQEVIR